MLEDLRYDERTITSGARCLCESALKNRRDATNLFTYYPYAVGVLERKLAMQRIVVLNPKGGSGKTTIAINLAACYAANGERPALMDLDPQASSMRWLRKRPHEAPRCHGSAAPRAAGHSHT